MSTLHESHLDDAELMQILDSEHAAEVADMAGHLDVCGECTAGLQRLRDDAALLGDWLERAAFEERAPLRPAAPDRGVVKPRAWSAGWLRAAAVLLLVAGPVAAVPQLRAWVVGIIGGAEAIDDQAATRAADAPAVDTPLTVRFTPGAASVTLTFDAAPAAGTVAVGRTGERDAVLTIAGAAGQGPVLSAAGARIRNEPAAEDAAAANYTLLVPGSVSEIVMRVPGRENITFDRAAIDAGAVIRFDTP